MGASCPPCPPRSPIWSRRSVPVRWRSQQALEADRKSRPGPATMVIRVRDRFGSKGALRLRAGRALRFFDLRAPKTEVGHTLNPLGVGSIPTRPTNSFKHLASPSGGALCFVGRWRDRYRSRLRNAPRDLSGSSCRCLDHSTDRQVNAYSIAVFMISKICVLCRSPLMRSEPGPTPKAYSGEAVCVWLPQPTRRYGRSTNARLCRYG